MDGGVTGEKMFPNASPGSLWSKAERAVSEGVMMVRGRKPSKASQPSILTRDAAQDAGPHEWGHQSRKDSVTLKLGLAPIELSLGHWFLPEDMSSGRKDVTRYD